MEKIKNLQEKAKILRRLPEQFAKAEPDAAQLLTLLLPLFVEIDAGNVSPPQKYTHGLALGKEPELYERHKEIFSAEADFTSALEDWPSQAWYKKLQDNNQK
jgi:hypothetical protein